MKRGSVDLDVKGENAAFWSRIASSYDKLIDDDYKSMIQRIVEDVGPVDRVLDVATGTGFIALELAKNVKRVEAVDFVEEMVAAARMKASARGISNVQFSSGSAYKLDFPDHCFDAVILSNSLHIMREPEKALREARRVLKAEGVLVVPTFCLGEIKDSKRKFKKLSEKGFKVYHFFSAQDFTQLVQRVGFRVMLCELFVSIDLPMLYLTAAPVEHL